MKIVSDYPELEGQKFDTEELCKQAEAVIDAEKEKAAKEKAAAEKAASKIKKEKAEKVELASKELEAARESYAKAKEEARIKLEESNAEISKILDTAQTKLREARKNYDQALFSFNQDFGPFNVKVYTGKEAEEKYKEALKEFEDIQNSIDSCFATGLRMLGLRNK